MLALCGADHGIGESHDVLGKFSIEIDQVTVDLLTSVSQLSASTFDIVGTLLCYRRREVCTQAHQRVGISLKRPTVVLEVLLCVLADLLKAHRHVPGNFGLEQKGVLVDNA